MESAQKIAHKDQPKSSLQSSVYKKDSDDKLRLLGFPESLVKLIRLFALHPSEKWRFRKIQQRLQVGSASLQRDLERLVRLDVAIRDVSDSTISYSVAENSKVWWALLQLVRELSDPEALVKEAVKDVPGIDAAFIYGSVATGTATKDSDIDLFVVADNLNRLALFRNLAKAQLLTGKEIHTIAYSKEQLASRLAGRTRFVREVLQGKKLWVGGDPKEIAPLAIAAGLPTDWASSTRHEKEAANVA